MLRVAQEAIGGTELAGRLRVENASVPKRAQGGQKAGLPQFRLLAAAHELLDLHAELSIANAPGAQFQIVGPAAIVHPPGFHRPHLVDRPEVQVAAIHKGLDGIKEGGANGEVARAGPRLDEGVAFPVAALGLEVAGHGGAIHDQRAAAAVGTQAHVHAEREAVLGDAVQRLDQALANAREEVAVRQAGGGAPVLGKGEDQVNVRRQVELAATELAQGEHRQPLGLVRRCAQGLAMALGLPALHHAEGRFNQGIRQVGERTHGLLERCEPQEVAPDDAELPTIAQPPQGALERRHVGGGGYAAELSLQDGRIRRTVEGFRSEPFGEPLPLAAGDLGGKVAQANHPTGVGRERQLIVAGKAVRPLSDRPRQRVAGDGGLIGHSALPSNR